MVQGRGLASRSATAQTSPVNQASQYLLNNIFFKYWEQRIQLKKLWAVFVHSILSLKNERHVLQSAKPNNITLSHGGSLVLFVLIFLFFSFFFLGEGVYQ